ncbi:FIG00741478: hypothetical protein [hydrothermal vent metagenome]|uniref:Chemotaxis response - phosphatase CheZ n=1 Tax=hydrothermal vent metagenome TaxID=652676 RepID=A0A3B0TI81_9ZZZZ
MSNRRQRQVFSIVSNRGADAQVDSGTDDIAERRHREIMSAIARMQGAAVPADGPTDEDAANVKKQLDDYRASMEQMLKLKSELDHIHGAIAETKKEIAGLHQSGVSGENMATVTDELDEVVNGTEQATEAILTAAEEIDRNAGDLSASLKQSQNRDQAQEIQERVIQIFEACNFQDITGQRINKVVNTLKYVEDRVTAMMSIWGGLDAFDNIKGEPLANPSGDHELLHGPGDIEEDPTRASQDDIDALFN